MFEQLQTLFPQRYRRALVAKPALGISQIVQPDRLGLIIPVESVRSRFRQLDHILIASQESQRLQSCDGCMLFARWMADNLSGEFVSVVAAA